MDIKKIEILLERYYEGKSSLTEEKELISFFMQAKTVPKYLEVDKAYFTAKIKTIEQTVPTDLEASLSTSIDQWDKASRPPSVVLTWAKWGIGIAACFLLIFTAIKQRPLTMSKSLTIEEKAICQQANDALYKFSSLFNKGLDKFQTLETEKQKIQTYLKKESL